MARKQQKCHRQQHHVIRDALPTNLDGCTIPAHGKVVLYRVTAAVRCFSPSPAAAAGSPSPAPAAAAGSPSPAPAAAAGSPSPAPSPPSPAQAPLPTARTPEVQEMPSPTPQLEVKARVVAIRKCPDSSSHPAVQQFVDVCRKQGVWGSLASITVDSAAGNIGRISGLAVSINALRRQQGLALIIFWPCVSHQIHNALHKAMTTWGKAEGWGRQGLQAQLALSIEQLCSLTKKHWDLQKRLNPNGLKAAARRAEAIALEVHATNELLMTEAEWQHAHEEVLNAIVHDLEEKLEHQQAGQRQLRLENEALEAWMRQHQLAMTLSKRHQHRLEAQLRKCRLRPSLTHKQKQQLQILKQTGVSTEVLRRWADSNCNRLDTHGRTAGGTTVLTAGGTTVQPTPDPCPLEPCDLFIPTQEASPGKPAARTAAYTAQQYLSTARLMLKTQVSRRRLSTCRRLFITEQCVVANTHRPGEHTTVSRQLRVVYKYLRQRTLGKLGWAGLGWAGLGWAGLGW
ncbi:hypothetical protein QJQ45_026579 [Haematococcus lacustris]|nr:hypothetical protein QJQ45_026579 [Haematococcus lacustris]